MKLNLLKSKCKDAPAPEEKKEEKGREMPEVEEIAIDDFMKVDLRVAEVIEVEPVKKADKLLKLNRS